MSSGSWAGGRTGVGGHPRLFRSHERHTRKLMLRGITALPWLRSVLTAVLHDQDSNSRPQSDNGLFVGIERLNTGESVWVRHF